MAILPIEDALLREPNLWVPGKKPVGPVKIDWEHPITSGLISAVLVGSNNIDLVTGTMWTPSNVTKDVIPGRGLSYKSVRVDESKLTSSKAFPSTVVDSFTVAHDIYQHLNVANWRTIWCLDKSSYAGGAFAQMNLNSIEYFIGSSASSYSIHYLSTNELHSLAFTNNNAANSRKYYQDGEIKIDGVSATAPAGDNTAQLFVVDNLATDRSTDALVSYWYLWDRDLSATEIMMIHHDPYQILMPA